MLLHIIARFLFFFFSSRRRHTRCSRDWSSDVCSSDLELQARWETGRAATVQRRNEDLRSCHRLGASSRYFSIPDCIYRRHPHTGDFLYDTEASLNSPLLPGDNQEISALQEELQQSLH